MNYFLSIILKFRKSSKATINALKNWFKLKKFRGLISAAFLNKDYSYFLGCNKLYIFL